MINKRILAIAKILLLTFAVPAGNTLAEIPPTDQTQVISAMESMYVALTNDDLEIFHRVTAPGFYSFDNGKLFVGDTLIQLLKKVHAEGKIYVWRVTEPKVEIDGDSALITYINKGSVQDASGKKDMKWLESAYLRKKEGVWRIHFFHSTRAP